MSLVYRRLTRVIVFFTEETRVIGSMTGADMASDDEVRLYYNIIQV